MVIAAFGALVTAVTGIARFVYLDLRKDRDYWRAIALRSTGVSEKATDVAVAASRDA